MNGIRKMTAQVGDYVRASFDFPKGEVSDLSLSQRDLVKIVDVIDENWAFGKKVALDDLCGNFPLSYVEHVTLPSTSVGQKLFLALEDFPFKQNGDLELKKGDIILGLEAVDDMWWKGQNDSQKGIFPLSIVVELNVKNRHPPRSYIKTSLNSHSEDSKSGAESDIHIKGDPKIKDVIYARALVDVIPQRDGELAFGQGDLIEITETVDKDWLYGRFGSEEGFVLAACVQVSNGGSQFKSNSYSDNNVVLNTDVSFHGALSTYKSQNDAESLKLESSENRPIGSSSPFNVGIKLHNIEKGPYGRVKQNFISQNPSELSLNENNIVFLIKHIDPDWTEGEVDGKRGVFPTSYIDIIVDCQSVSNPDLKESQFSTKSCKAGYNSKHSDIGSMKTETVSCSYKCDSDTGLLNMGTSAHTIIGDNKLKCTGSSSTISVDPSENIPDQCSQSQTKNKGYRKNSAPSILTIKPDLPVKPANSHKPPVASKSSITGKPSTLTSLSSLQAMKLTEASTQISNMPATGVNTPKASSIIHYFEEKIAKSKTADRIQSLSFTQLKTEDALNVSVQNDKTVKKKSHLDLAECTLSDMNMNTCSVSFHHPTRTAPTRPAVTSPGIGISEAPSVKTQGPPPRVSSITTTVSSESVPALKHVRKRQSPEGHSNRTQIIRRSTQPISSHRAQSPPRQPVRPTSFPSAPKRPPPRPAGYVLYSPRGQITEEDTTLPLVINLREKLQAITDGIEKYGTTKADLEKSVAQDDSQEKRTETENTLNFIEKQLAVLHEEKGRLEENLLAANTEDAKLEKSRLLAAQHAVDEEKRKEEEEIRKEEERNKKEEMRAKRKIHREKVIEEIMNTEKDYFTSLQLCLETFYDGQDPPPGVDLDFLLGNMEEIADVSQKILASLEACVTGKSIEEQCIGQCFINFAEDMRNTYAPYCRNHDEVINALEQYADSSSFNSYLSCKIDKMKEQSNVFDMASVLIRPVQRILKYPLLLNELLKNTEEGHPDREDIETAIKEMTDVAKAINEYKRRKDLVYKYKTLTDETFSDKISKLNLHSIKKKSSRIRGRLSTNFGIALQLTDEMFDKEEAKFRSLEKAVKVFLDSVQQYLDHSQETMRCQTVYVDDIMDFYKDKECAEATKLYEVTCKQLSHFDSMKETVDIVVIVPLNILVGLFSGPTKVIEKRYDKLLDYNSQLGKLENDKELQAAKNDYEAMNAQLLDELPKFYNLAFRMLRHCISAFVLARRDFMDQSLKETCSLLELQSIASKANLMEIFKIRHTTAFDHVSMLSFIPKGFNPRVDTVKGDRAIQKGQGRSSTDGSLQKRNSLQFNSGSQNETQRRYLQQLYPPDKLYTVNSTYNATDLMDISLTEGTLVGVVKQLDPMGNTERWFVDDGGSKGFIPCSILQPLEFSPSSSLTYADEDDDIISILSGDSGDNMVFTGNDDRVDYHSNNSFTESYSQKSELPQFQYYYALYDFKPRQPNETSLTAGHPVTVLTFHDLEGNSEWWLVDSEGKKGYAPANYMAPVPYS